MGVAQDEAAAFAWFEKGADLGGAGAFFGLGSCYKYSTGCAQDQAEAERLLEKARELGHNY
jgi:TPR repeat protein